MHVKLQTCLPENLSHDFLPLRGAGRSGHSVVKKKKKKNIYIYIYIQIDHQLKSAQWG